MRETRRTNRDGSVVAYLQFAHNERHPGTGSPVAKMIHSFGRGDQVDRAALAQLVTSISRFLTSAEAVAAVHGVEVEVVDSRRMGGAWTLDRVWERLGIGAAIRRVAASRRLDGHAVERVVFTLVAIENLPGCTDDQAYRAMDFLLEALGRRRPRCPSGLTPNQRSSSAGPAGDLSGAVLCPNIEGNGRVSHDALHRDSSAGGCHGTRPHADSV